MTCQTDQDWIAEGVKVVQLTTNVGNETVVVSTIERLTPTQVVCANGERFNRRRLTKSTSTYGPHTDLIAYDSPEGQRAVARMRRRNAIAKVRKAAAELAEIRRDGSEDDALLAALNALEEAPAAARDVIARIANH